MSEQCVREYLETLKSSLWGRSFSLKDEESIEQAIKFILETFDGVKEVSRTKWFPQEEMA
jgi:hypothetical protein